MTFKFAETPPEAAAEEPSGLHARGEGEPAESPRAASSSPPESGPRTKHRALLVGAPNVGKSVLFGALTGHYVTVSNYPGTTVEITRGRVALGTSDDDHWELLDSPGTNNLVAMSEDEAVTRDILLTERHDALIQVGDAKNLARTLLMTLQLAELGVPFLLDLNMMDEARARGLSIDFAALGQELGGVRVNGSAAVAGEGIEPLREYLAASAVESKDADRSKNAVRAPLSCAPSFSPDVEAAIATIEAALPELPVAKRAVATLLLAGDRGLGGALHELVPSEVRALAADEAEKLRSAHALPVFALLSKLRLGRAQAIVRAVQSKAETAGGAVANGGGVPWLQALPIAALASAIAAWALSQANAAMRVPAIALFVLATPIATALVHRHARGRVAAWKLAFAFGAGYFVDWIGSLFSASPIVDYVAAGAGLLALIALARAGDKHDTNNTRTFGRLATHHVWGVPILVVVLFFAYKIVGEFGAGTAVDFLENGVFGGVAAQVDLRGPSSTDNLATSASDTAAEGAERLVYVPDGTPGSSKSPTNLCADAPCYPSVAPQVKTGGTYVADPGARVDFYRETGRTAPSARVWTGYANRAAYAFFAWLGIPLLTAFMVGTYGFLTMGVTYAVAIVLPVVATFFFVFSVLEDSGYLPRLAVMANRQLRMIGLNGKAVLPMVLGLGCDTMATLTARILETKKERILVTLILALGIPCSSQLSVVFALMQRTSGAATVAWLASVFLTIGVVGWVSAKVVPGDPSDFLLEMPPIRRPMLGNLATKTFARIEWYLKEAVPLFLIGTALLFVLDLFNLLVYVHRAGEPIVHGILGFTRDRAVSDKVSEALLIGFLRRDFGAAGLLDLARGGQLSTADIAVSMVTITLFIPCIANVFMIWKERGWKVATTMCAFIFPYAVAVGWIVRGVFHVLHVGGAA